MSEVVGRTCLRRPPDKHGRVLVRFDEPFGCLVVGKLELNLAISSYSDEQRVWSPQTVTAGTMWHGSRELCRPRLVGL